VKSRVPADQAEEPSDADLVTRAQGGESGAFESLVKRHIRAAHAVAFAVLAEQADVDDAVQDGFLSALRHLDSCSPPEKFRAWLLTIVRNRAFDMKRREQWAKVPERIRAPGTGRRGFGNGP
jgi:RNA polymerase sigma-70 factor (ECF subfamily)